MMKYYLSGTTGLLEDDLINVKLKDTDFSNCDLSGVNLCNTDLRGANLSNVNTMMKTSTFN